VDLVVEMVNGTGFFLGDLTEHQRTISDLVNEANSTKKSLYADWKGRDNAKNRVFGTLVLIVIILMAATALILMKSKDKELSIKKRAHKLFERKKENIIDQLHSRDADERARSALMAGASAEVDESIIPLQECQVGLQTVWARRHSPHKRDRSGHYLKVPGFNHI